MAVRSHATLARLNYITDPLPLQVAQTATPGWLLAIGIDTIGTPQLSDSSLLLRLVLVIVRATRCSNSI